MTVRRRTESNAFQTTISILDFVTICLGATLLLVVMVPNQSRSQAVIASQQEALQLVRKFFAENTMTNNVHLSDDLVARHPSLSNLDSRAPHEYEGKRLSVLDENQRVRRAELLVEIGSSAATIERRLNAVIPTLRERGIGYLYARAFSIVDTVTAHPNSVSPMALTSSDTGASIASDLNALSPSLANEALQAAETSRHQSATPAEPIIVIIETTAGLKSIVDALPASICPAGDIKRQAGLLIIGPPIDSTNVDTVEGVLSACGRSDYVVSP